MREYMPPLAVTPDDVPDAWMACTRQYAIAEQESAEAEADQRPMKKPMLGCTPERRRR